MIHSNLEGLHHSSIKLSPKLMDNAHSASLGVLHDEDCTQIPYDIALRHGRGILEISEPKNARMPSLETLYQEARSFHDVCAQFVDGQDGDRRSLYIAGDISHFLRNGLARFKPDFSNRIGTYLSSHEGQLIEIPGTMVYPPIRKKPAGDPRRPPPPPPGGDTPNGMRGPA